MNFSKKILNYFIIYFIFIFHINSFSISVTFINPGKSDEDFWVTSGKFTEAAAKNLGIKLESVYAQRNRIYMVKIAEEIAKRTVKPDFVLIVNEKLSAEEIIPILNEAKIKTILIHVDLTKEQKNILKRPREKYKYWLSTIVPDNTYAGYLIAEEIYKDALNKIKHSTNFNLIAINGDKATPASIERGDGLKKFLEKHSNIHLKQSIYAEWKRDIAFEQMQIMLERYSNINLIWAANDPIALGALKATKEKNRLPGKNIFLGGLNWSKESIFEVKNGTLSTTVGGHFMNGACALVYIYDYLHGKDLLNNQYEMNIKIFSAIHSFESNEFLKYLDESNWHKINLKNFSKTYHSNIKDYSFNSKDILRTIRK
ncbi:ABC transporter substrate-binding protein [Silvanigrella aquatica]|uniref:Periplasmic binding protein domain-containing protein n=1 Tax=Silvanigrella aquatica TaxID=1915309 RepID=A0A1L4D3J4_9BACT|nr:ABC transporter substrate-binding protein [Silvanigrella aquatica]APJ04759.1 hypothetical protein AXG55_12975 [Silvanigrella aquatica]